jgi:peptidoglycan/LPS O-acetylase OafA/YrhL
MTNLATVDGGFNQPQPANHLAAERDVAFLNPLTGLRFFAAFAIMMLHGGMIWQMPAGIASLSLNQGVSFFFVLSGFILTYVYRELRSLKAVFLFYVTRLARIWPVHIAATILLFIVLPATAYVLRSRQGLELAALYVTLTQAWLPIWDSFLQLNGISWTISVEWFFYLLFPLFLLDWRTSEWVKLLVAAVPALLVIAFSNAIHAPQGDWAPGLTEHGLIYIFPPSRLFEFVFGVVCAKTWLSTMADRRPTAVVSFVFELVAVVGVYFALRYCGPTSRTQFVNDIGGSAGAHWLLVNGFTPAFAFLIFVFASSTGPLATFVGSRLLVRLGEISFSLYMVHTIVLDIFERYPRTITALTSYSVFVFWAVSILTAYCMWHFVETPARRAIVRVLRRCSKPTRATGKSSISARSTSLEAIFPTIALVAVVVFFGATLLFPRAEIQEAQSSELDHMSWQPTGRVEFGGKYELLGSNVSVVGAQTWLDVFIRANTSSRLVENLGLHILDANGVIKGSAAFPLDMAQSTVAPGTTWKTRLVLGNGVFIANPSPVAFVVFNASGALALTAGKGDWNNHRYLTTLVRPK